MKQSNKSILSIFLIFYSFIAASTAYSWGAKGHRMVASLGAQLVKTNGAFWAANAEAMASMSTVPDQFWKFGADSAKEKPTHWFQPDSYYSNPQDFVQFPRVFNKAVTKFGQEKVLANGTAPWRIKQLYDLSVKAFKAKDYKKGLQMAGTMSHYIGDLSQPLHVTKNHDGQETGNTGIHKFFESTNIDSAEINQLTLDVKKVSQRLLTNQNFLNAFNSNLTDALFNEIDRSYAQKDKLIKTDISQDRDSAALLEIAKSRLADGAATLAVILEKLSADAGLDESNGSSIKIEAPKWVSLSYVKVARGRAPSFFPQSETMALAEYLNDGSDCDQ